MPPGTSMLPVMVHRQMMAWATEVPSGSMSTGTPQWTAAGLLVANILEAWTMVWAGMSVMAATLSTGYSWTRSFSLSKP